MAETDRIFNNLLEFWQFLAKEEGGSVRKIQTAPGIFGGNSWLVFELDIPYRNGNIIFRWSEASPLKVRYLFPSTAKFEILIYPADFMDQVAIYFGSKDFKTGNGEFDKKMIVKGFPRSFVMKILDDQLINYLLKYKTQLSNFRILKKKEVYSLEMNIQLNENDTVKTREMIDVIKHVADNLFEIE
ncbi:MAG: hypothetical protein CVU11_01310 [Bacteroidetes bacterium HGW-Bacteroidetes-6]|jgi:hypothetical protein|nr:MAG: hypothetical protein CVU11_01310 [Bacteroidetes bacterium HGW-Bacteroidetes-6]